MKVGVKIGEMPEQIVEVPVSDCNLGEKNRERATAVMDNFIDVRIPLHKAEIERLNAAGGTLSGASVTVPVVIRAISPGVVIDKVGLEIETKQ